jgi:subtilisin family serine protease
LVALAQLSKSRPIQGEPTADDAVTHADAASRRKAEDEAVLEEVALQFADRFGAGDRAYEGPYEDSMPVWHTQVIAAIGELEEKRLVARKPDLALTKAGRGAVRAARARLAKVPSEPPQDMPSARTGPSRLLLSGVLAAPLREEASTAIGVPPSGDEVDPRGAVTDAALGKDETNEEPAKDDTTHIMVELNLRFGQGPGEAFNRLDRLWSRVADDRRPYRLTEEYATGALSWSQLLRLVSADAVPVEWSRRAIFRIWPDFELKPQMDASVVTVKADAAHRSFNCYGDDIVWAVVDSGIEETHPHFTGYDTLHDPTVRDLHRTFTGVADPTPEGALVDELGHGTHVAGIIAGGLDRWTKGSEKDVVVTQERYNVADPGHPFHQPRTVNDAKAKLVGMAPRAKLVSLKVLNAGGSSQERAGRVIQALAYVRQINAASDKLPRIHGVNLSLGYDFDPEWFACGRSPLCQEVDKLVRTGVIVVAAAGNSGYGRIATRFQAPQNFSFGMTINDPGNAERAITVGSTHRDSPHGYGVSYFSSRGPTGDGRHKPDLVAPGERITSAAAGSFKAPVKLKLGQDAAVYVESSGTSMAAPHVSGAIAAFLSVRREFIGRPDEVKRIFIESATPLGRDPSFEGGGLLDLMRALQTV